MKKAIGLLVIFIFPLLCKTQVFDILKIRGLYYKATTNKSDAEILLKTLQNSPDLEASLINGYTGMVYMLNAEYAFNPYTKLNYFLKGKGLLDDAIKADQKNVELRFLRYCAQTNAPAFLNYNGNISEDKTVIVVNYKKLNDSDLKKRIKVYLQTSKECSREEKQILN